MKGTNWDLSLFPWMGLGGYAMLEKYEYLGQHTGF